MYTAPLHRAGLSTGISAQISRASRSHETGGKNRANSAKEELIRFGFRTAEMA
jgi:hypothetical protein